VAYDRLPLNALRVFEAVATRLNFGAAAEALNVTPAAVSQQIKTLEDYLRAPLFRRNGRKVELTPEGIQLLPGVRRGLDELEETLHRLKQDRESGTVNVSTLSSFLQRWLTPRLGDLRERHPEVQLRIHTSPEVVDFARTDFHAALRLGTGRYPGLYSEKIMDEWVVAIASPKVFKKFGALPDTGDISSLPLLHGNDTEWAIWMAGEKLGKGIPRGSYIDDSSSLLSAVIEGLGYSIIRWSLVAHELRAGRVVLASDRVLPHRLAYYFVCPEVYVDLPKLAMFRKWLMEQARDFALPPVPQRAKLRSTA
jgi:LysR family transcriptional regulator, glycine cleavage system transcriptional activator